MSSSRRANAITILVFLFISIPSHVLVRAAAFNHDTVQDATGSDGYSFSACFTGGVLEPAVVSLDIMEFELTSEDSPLHLGRS